MKQKIKLSRDIVISLVDGKELVGVYPKEENGREILGNFEKEIADKIIELWNENVR